MLFENILNTFYFDFIKLVTDFVCRSWIVTSSQINVDPYFLNQLQKLSYQDRGSLLILDSCHIHNYTQRCEVNSGQIYAYPRVLQDSVFCLVFRGERMGQFVLLEAMAANCIPVIVIDGHVMPFNNVIDWKRFSIFIMESHLNTLMDVLNNISKKRIRKMQNVLLFMYKSYFSSMEHIALTTLDIIQDRVYPHLSRTYDEINLMPSEVSLERFKLLYILYVRKLKKKRVPKT